MRLPALLVLWPGLAAAEPPAPLLLPELVPGARIAMSAGLAAGSVRHADGNGAELGQLAELSATVALARVELFASIPVRRTAELLLFGRAPPDEADVGNLRIGARYDAVIGPLVVAPAAWLWLPTSSEPGIDDPGFLHMQSVEDARAFGAGMGGAGLALDVAWRSQCSFVQVEGGAAFVSDQRASGPQVDNVFVAIGAGTRLTPRTSLIGEWRFAAFPDAGFVEGPIVGVGWHDTNATAYRVRLHVSGGGGALTFDLVHRFR